MSLSTSLSLAQSALANSSAQMAILSSNIANVNNANYNLRTAGTISQTSGSVSLGATQRATNAALLATLLAANASSGSSQALSNGLTQISDMLGLDTQSTTSSTTATDRSASTMIGALTTALQQYAAQPDNAALGTAAVTAATSLASNLNQASTSVQNIREQADQTIASSVATINSLLAQFQTVNNTITSGAAAGVDTSTAMDTRDGILKQLSGQIGITTVAGANNSMSIYTDSGVTLFETTPRTVSFTPTSSYSAGTVGNPVTVDGVPVTGASAVMPIASGALAGLTTLRDTTAAAYQNQLDQTAAGLVTAFAEIPSGGATATLPGLFTAPTLGGALPTTATTTGLAANITVNSRVDPTKGGTVTLLRDGNISGGSTNQNPNSDASYAATLQSLVTAIGQTQTFNPASGGIATGTLAAYAQSSVSWLEAANQTATNTSTYQNTVVGTTTTALSNATGVNLDEELSKMLDIEHAYQASAQLLNTVGSLYTSLLTAVH